MTASMYALRHADDRAEVREALLGEREVLLAGVGAGADAGDPLVDDRRRVRHRADDRDAGGDVRLDRAVRIAAATERMVCSGVSSRADLAEQRLDVLRLDRDDDEAGARDGLALRERRRDAVAAAELGDALLAAARSRRPRPARASRELSRPAEQRLADLPAAEDRDATVHRLESTRATQPRPRAGRRRSSPFGPTADISRVSVPSYGEPLDGSRRCRPCPRRGAGSGAASCPRRPGRSPSRARCAISSPSSCAWSSWPCSARNSVSSVTRQRGSRSQARRTLSSGVPTVHGIVSIVSVTPCSSAMSASAGRRSRLRSR